MTSSIAEDHVANLNALRQYVVQSRRTAGTVAALGTAADKDISVKEIVLFTEAIRAIDEAIKDEEAAALKIRQANSREAAQEPQTD